jgi:hypothetical protein
MQRLPPDSKAPGAAQAPRRLPGRNIAAESHNLPGSRACVALARYCGERLGQYLTPRNRLPPHNIATQTQQAGSWPTCGRISKSFTGHRLSQREGRMAHTSQLPQFSICHLDKNSVVTDCHSTELVRISLEKPPTTALIGTKSKNGCTPQLRPKKVTRTCKIVLYLNRV